MTARTADGQSSGYFLRSHYDINKLDTKRIAREAIRKALEGTNAKTIEPGIYTVILEPQAVADLLGDSAFGFNARNAEEGRSVYSAPGGKTRLGEKIFDERITIYSDPWNPELPGSQSAQGGMPAEKLYLVKNGVIENLIYNRFWAKQKGKEPTPGPVNTILEAVRQDSYGRGNDQVDRPRHSGQPFLVHPRDRCPHRQLDRADPRRRVADRKRQDRPSGEEFPLQPVGRTRCWHREMSR